MKLKTIIVILTLIIGLIVIIWLGKINQTNLNSNSQAQTQKIKSSSLLANELLYNFGTISMQDGLVEKTFQITNPTTQDVKLSRVVTSCMCTKAYIENNGKEKGPFGMVGHGGPVPMANEIIEAGKTIAIKVVYDPNAHGPAGVGTIDRFIELTEENGAVTKLEIKALVTP